MIKLSSLYLFIEKCRVLNPKPAINSNPGFFNEKEGNRSKLISSPKFVLPRLAGGIKTLLVNLYGSIKPPILNSTFFNLAWAIVETGINDWRIKIMKMEIELFFISS
jgi:hypothetical protein